MRDRQTLVCPWELNVRDLSADVLFWPEHLYMDCDCMCVLQCEERTWWHLAFKLFLKVQADSKVQITEK